MAGLNQDIIPVSLFANDFYTTQTPAHAQVAWPITCVHFDGKDNLLWVGNHQGRLTSYEGSLCTRTVSVLSHSDSVTSIAHTQPTVLSLSATGLRLHSRGGRSVAHITEGIQGGAQVQSLKSAEATVIGTDMPLTTFSLASHTAIRTADAEPLKGTHLVRAGRQLCCATTDGKLCLVDPATLKTTKVLTSHFGGVSAVDASGHYVASCGYTNSHGPSGYTSFEPYVRIYDTRAQRQLPLVQVPNGAALVRFVPHTVMSQPRLAVITQHNQLVFKEMAGGSGIGMQSAVPLDTEGYAECMSLSPSTQALCIGDSMGVVRVYGWNEEPLFSQYSDQPEMPSENPRLFDSPIHPDDYTQSLSFLHVRKPVLSSWPAKFANYRRRLQPEIPPTVAAVLRTVDFVGHAPNNTTLRANQVQYDPKYLRDPREGGDDSGSVEAQNNDTGPSVHIPEHYARVVMKYSHMGIEEYNVSDFNNTSYCGLETETPNAYCNAALQVLYHIPRFSAMCQSHFCREECCLTCELGFLFSMLDTMPSRNCQATNFLRAFRTIPQAVSLGLLLLDETADKADLLRTIQSWQTFVLSHVDKEIRERSSKPSKSDSDSSAEPEHTMVDEFTSMWCTQIRHNMKCYACKSVTSPEKAALIFSLNVPHRRTAPSTRPAMQRGKNTAKTNAALDSEDAWSSTSFSDLVSSTLELEEDTKNFCKTCNQFKACHKSQRVLSLGKVLVFNCGSSKESQDDNAFWKFKAKVPKSEENDSSEKEENNEDSDTAQKGEERDVAHSFIPPQLVFETTLDGQLRVTELHRNVDEETPRQVAGHNKDDTGTPDRVVYELVGAVFHIKSKGSGHLVSVVQVPPCYNAWKVGEARPSWVVFNDFSVTYSSLEDAVTYDPEWKMPCVLYYMRSDLAQTGSAPAIHVPLRQYKETLMRDPSLAVQPTMNLAVQLSETAIPGPGDVVAIDAEFVSLKKEDVEIRSRNVANTFGRNFFTPAHMAVARVSLVAGYDRGQHGPGSMRHQCILDDFVKNNEPVVDYLTKYSGIRHGDLDPKTTTRHLTTLKNVYTKLRYLVLRGVKLVGHGLPKDFRVLNLIVPEHQIIDTVDIFYLAGRRKLSLKFLAWYFLKIDMQRGHDGHDSIEDALTALRLYEKYLQLSQDRGRWQDELQKLYEAGQKYGWKPPAATP